jgi:hypothetical protein
LLATKIVVGIILLGVSCEYVNNNRRESTGSTTINKEQVPGMMAGVTEPPIAETTTLLAASLEKAHTRSVSLLHLNELVS